MDGEWRRARRRASACGAPRDGRTSTPGGGRAVGQPTADLQPALERLEVEGGGAARLRGDHRFEHPVAQRQPDPQRPAQAGRQVVGVASDGVDLDADAVLVLAPQAEGRARFEDRDAARRGRSSGRPRSGDPQAGARRERPGVEPLDPDDARGDEPGRIALDVDQRREDRRPAAGRCVVSISTWTVIGRRPSTGRRRNDGPCPRLSAGVP